MEVLDLTYILIKFQPIFSRPKNKLIGLNFRVGVVQLNQKECSGGSCIK